MIIRNSKGGKFAIFSSAFDSKAKMLYFFEFLFLFGTGALFLRLTLTSYEPGFVAVAIVVSVSAGLLIASYRFANKVVMSERLFVNQHQLQLIKKGLFSSNVRTFKITDISGFRHLKKPELTPHALAGGSFDYLGFQTEQRVISEMHGDNRMAFDWKGNTITFGQDVYSWDFEELNNILLEITGEATGRNLPETEE